LGEFGTEAYVVVHVEDARVMGTVTDWGVSVDAAVGVADATLEPAASCAPIARADFLKLSKELGASPLGQLTAKTMPCPQWDCGVWAACLQ